MDNTTDDIRTIIPGQTYNVFDGAAWYRLGDIGDNSCFWKAAEVISVYELDNERMVDVRFIASGRVSRGHFTTSLRPL